MGKKLTWLLAAVTIALCSPVAMLHAQTQEPVRLLVGFPPGGIADILARELAEGLRQGGLNREVIVENRPGAGGRIAGEALSRAAPDGNTFLIAPDGWAIFPHLIEAPGVLNYNVLTDMVPVARLASFEIALIAANKNKVSNASEYEAYVKQAGSGLYGVPSIRGHMELLGTFFSELFGVPFTAVGYKGNAPLSIDLMGGQVAAGVMTAGDAVRMGDKVHIIGIVGEKRSPVAPNVPTLGEQGYEPPLNGRHWMGMWAPAGTPDNKLAQMESEVKRIVSSEAFAKKILESSLINANYASGAELDRIIREDVERWKPIVDASGMRDRH